ncbi:Glucosyltransferase MdoH [Candidatus Filomicrobium marinum]|uniref:Glucans biosynthesis glucosyltransferase H n=1 Tax=Candidatus Filomicrobium marinum TaxID=1608628 RepID=A0A0D6JFP9_9HYPH|nr:glucans biosynthesis glucosyltransferase MdoH [Candidatus Filomicrobium marinum]CFX26514.1 Glucosyltransferase MdoH [Candidatus Filomicrobium marinum]CPR19454.1 Glucosyltransferase MdoH [Candidatus Filomicrobium marinum]
MSETLDQANEPRFSAGKPTLSVPSGLQSMPELQRRRTIVAALNVVTYAVMMAAAAFLLSAGGWTTVDLVVFLCLMIGTPWAILGFWNAVIGLWLLHGHKAPMAAVAPFARAADDLTPLYVKTAVFMTLRNEDPKRAVARLQTIKRSLDATGEGATFSYFLLSDTNVTEVAELEEKLAAEWQASDPDGERIVYRRRADNVGFKAGNVRDFCARWGDQFELMLPLDADSLMSGDAIVKMARMMQAHPRLGILQSLVVGMPSSSAFARIFQFGMRHGMRSYTMGQAWWVADCGPFWGHNAMVRVHPFYNDCELPVLPGKPPLGGHVLSHDQVEATLMRRAGYEVRVLPFEIGSWEENPPTMLDFAKREVRWCQGNLQYIKLLNLPGLLPLSRFQLLWAVLMFLGVPALTVIIALLPALALEARTIPDYPAGLAITLYLAFMLMHLTPKLAGLVDAMLTKGGVASFGGPLRFTFSATTELVFSFLQGAVSAIRTSVFMFGLLLGRSVVWGGQSRDAYGLSWTTAALDLWPQTIFGLLVCGALAVISPETLMWSLPLTAGYLLAIPFAVFTASPRLGAWLQRNRLCAIPEDLVTPPEIATVQQESVFPLGKSASPRRELETV